MRDGMKQQRNVQVWPVVALEKIAKIDRTGIQPDNIIDGTVYVGLEHIQKGGKILKTASVLKGELASSKFKFSPKHVLYGKLRPYLAKIAIPQFNGICSTDILPILPSEKLDRTYLAYFLRQPYMVEHANSRAAGANLPRLSPKALSTFKIPLPPLPEQKRIAAILDQADALIRLRQKSLDRLNQLGQSIFYDMFGDPVTNPMGWPLEKLETVGQLDRGVSKHRPRNEPTLLGGKHPLIQTGDVSRAKDYITTFKSTYSDKGLAQSKMWPKGTLCITIAANIADTAILNFDACFPDSVVGFNANDNTWNYFIHWWFKAIKNELERVAPAVAQKNINLKILRELDVIVPDTSRLQEFYSIMQTRETQTEAAQKALNHSQTLFAALQQRAFKGEL